MKTFLRTIVRRIADLFGISGSPAVPLIPKKYEIEYDRDGQFWIVTVLTRLDGAKLPY